jgi:diguanylate cyclase (GGDEF)-like protein
MKEFQPENFSILVIDDNPADLKVIKKVLDRAGYNSSISASSQEALDSLKQAQPDLILMDLMMPEVDGFQLSVKLKSDPNFYEIPIIFITASHEQEHILKAFNLGAVDYVIKPFHHKELLARLKTHIELKHTRDELREALIEIEKLATKDYLTEIYNRRYFLTLAEREFRLACRLKRYFSVLIINLDCFKNLNDNYGHYIGDETLKLIANIILNSVRQEDLLARWGGEEFVIFLAETNPQGAMVVAERLRAIINESRLEIEDKIINITVSIGATSYNPEDRSLEDVLQRADKGLDEAKRSGRNRVCFFLPPDNKESR